MRAAHFLKHYDCEGKSWQRISLAIGISSTLTFLFKAGRKWGKSTQHVTNVSREWVGELQLDNVTHNYNLGGIEIHK